MTSQTGQQIVAIHILPDISRGKDNQTMKFDQLIGSNMRNVFFLKSYIKCVEEASPRLFYKKPKLSISVDQQSDIL